MTGPAWTLLAAAAVCLVVAGTVGPMAHEPSPDLQAACAAQAEAAFAELGRESRDVLERLQVPFDLTAFDYRAHYSNKAERCLAGAQGARHPACIVRHVLPHRRRRPPDVRALYRHRRQDGDVHVDSEHCGNDDLQGPRRIRRVCRRLYGRAIGLGGKTGR